MIYLYQSNNAKANLVKIGLTRTSKNGQARIADYARSNNLPTTGWSPPRHLALDTNNWAAARAVEAGIHATYAGKGKAVRKGGRTIREVFKGTASGVHWTCLRMAKASGLYKKGG